MLEIPRLADCQSATRQAASLRYDNVRAITKAELLADVLPAAKLTRA
jgi:hypothetical protein